jgi:hypothetical protein
MSFVLGANLPWIRYGGDFGANAWSPEGGLSTRPDDRQRALTVLLRLRDLGVTRVRWFFLCDLRAGVRFREDSIARFGGTSTRRSRSSSARGCC